METASLTSKQGVGEHEVALDCSEALPNVLTWIAELEEHPDPGDCGGVDYAAIYRYLAALCQVWISKQKWVKFNNRVKHHLTWTQPPVLEPRAFCPR